MPYSVLLGPDFWKSTGINVDFGSGIVTIPDILEISVQQTQNSSWKGLSPLRPGFGLLQVLLH